MVKPRANSWLDDLVAYVPGRYKGGENAAPARLASNETPLGPSPKAVEAARKAAVELHRYADGGANDLRDALSTHYNLEKSQIICGTGSDEILQLIAQAYAAPGDEIIHTCFGFMVYGIAARRVGARPVVAEEKNYTADVDAILAAVTDKTRVVFLANPNNPTGTILHQAEIERLHLALPEHVVLVIDGAYAEYVSLEDYDGGLKLAQTATNVIMTRTFSKIYGLAAERVGWAYGPQEIIDVLNKIRGPFNVTGIGQAAAIASLHDQNWMMQARKHNDHWRPWLENQLRQLHLSPIPSEGNFILVAFPETPGQTAGDANAYLTSKGFLLRHLPSMGLNHCLRLSVGSDEDNHGVIKALQDFLSTSL